MRRFLATAMTIVVAAGCAHLTKPRDYYPDAVFDDFTANWYGEHLRAMRELPLHGNTHRAAASSYRFLYLPTFSAPLMFRLEVFEEGNAILVTKRTDGLGGYGAGRLTYSHTTPVPSSLLDRYQKLIRDLEPHAMPTEVPEMRGLDGSEWILEVREGMTYHAISRWSALQRGDEVIEVVDKEGNRSAMSLRERYQEVMPGFDVDAYFSGTRRLVEVFGLLIEMSPLKAENYFPEY